MSPASIGDIDPSFNEDVAYAEGPVAARVPVTLDVVPGAPHGLERLGASTETASACLQRARKWFGQAIAARPR